MSRKIYKYQIRPMGTFTLSLPLPIKILHVGVQKNKPFFWAEVENTNNPLQEMKFVLVTTGADLEDEGDRGFPENYVYCGTFLLQQDSFVGHLYREVV